MKGKPFNKRLFGTAGVNQRSLELNLIPCIPKQITDQNRHLINKECLADYNDPASMRRKFLASKKYLGRPAIKVVTNTQRLDLKKYGEETIVKELKIMDR